MNKSEKKDLVTGIVIVVVYMCLRSYMVGGFRLVIAALSGFAAGHFIGKAFSSVVIGRYLRRKKK